ncbi:ABC transporter substrate-binding protein [Actinomadura sp. 1N219]|uniref:ABC transporter substrate-binding protein n=1 Tax=Actinomadura sp. 1N219 TaxID=3375152 RepID=UPI0037B78171
MHHPRRRILAALLLGGALTACGTGQAATAPPGTMKVGVVPATPAAAIYLAAQQGAFTEQGVKVTTRPVQTGSATVASLLNGELQAGYISSVVAIRAASEGMPIKFAAGGDSVPTDPNRRMYGGLVVPKGSPIKRMSDLEGRTVAVNALKGVDHLSTRAAVDEDGGDSAKVKFVEVPYPGQPSALKNGRVDAIMVSDPFYSRAMKEGGVNVGGSKGLSALGPGALVSGYIVSAEFAAQRADTVRRFAAAMNGASDRANRDHGAVRRIIPSYSGLPPAVVQRMQMPVFEPRLDPAALQRVIDLMTRYEFIDKPVTAGQLIAK